MTKVKSISIEGSEPTPIVDKGIDEAQSRNTVANTDVVKVQDGNGVWHAIPFNKFIEVATPLVASIMNNLNLQGNIAKFLGLNANGAPGVSSLADAAAALGVTLIPYKGSKPSNVDTAKQTGWYHYTDGSGYMEIFVVIRISSSQIMQMLFTYNTIKMRSARSTSEWLSWKSVSLA